MKDLGHWSGALEYRYLGAYTVVPDDSVTSPGYGEWNLNAAYTLASGWRFGTGLYNVLDTKADAAAFYYVDRLPAEPAAGVGDLHVHLIEPRTVRFTLSKTF
jgi:outer membrane receptor protein involved in Fe transport